MKAPRHWPLCGEFTETGEFPTQRASYAENVPIWWRHHGLWSHADEIIHSCFNFSGRLAKFPSKLGHGWGILSPSLLWYVIINHPIIAVDIRCYLLRGLWIKLGEKLHMLKSPKKLELFFTMHICDNRTRWVHKCFPWWMGSRMMTSSNGNIFRVTGPLCGEFTGPGEFPTQRPVTRSFDVSLICVWINGWVNNREAGDLRRHQAHCDVIVMGSVFC